MPTEQEVAKPEHEAHAYINWARWVVDCPVCNGGISADADTKTCDECGAVVAVIYPSNKEMQMADDVLGKRTAIENRNWYPQREDIADLKVENLKQGVKP